jgi:hypothetical protein
MSADERRDLDTVVTVFFGTPLDMKNRTKFKERLQLSRNLCLELDGDKSQSLDSAALNEIEGCFKILDLSHAKVLAVYEKQETKLPKPSWRRKKFVVSLLSTTLHR